MGTIKLLSQMLYEAFVSLDDAVDTPYSFEFRGKCKRDVDDYIAYWIERSTNPDASIKMGAEYYHESGTVNCWYYYNDYRNHPFTDECYDTI